MNLSTNETFPTNETPSMNETLPMNETIGAATVLVTGGNGFIGRHIVKHLHRFGASVLVSTSNRKTAARGSHARYLALHRVRTPEQWLEHLEGVDIVVNAVGILRERLFESYEQVHHHALDALATACAEKGVTLVHVSILGVDSPARSRFVKSKLRGEEAIKKSTANWFIVRPSLVDGVGGNGAKWFRRVAAWPVHFSPANAQGGFAPIDVDDLGEAVARIALSDRRVSKTGDRVIELSGDKTLTVFEYLDLLNPYARRARKIPVPSWLARLVSHICDFLYVTPFSYGHYELLQYRNFPARNQLGDILGRPPRRIPKPHPAPAIPEFN